jgi:hypothetical protein
MKKADVYLHMGLLDSVPKTGTQRRRIMDFVRSLREAPETEGDFTDRDASDRNRQIKIIGDYAITYWHDAPVSAVMVVDIRHADR